MLINLTPKLLLCKFIRDNESAAVPIWTWTMTREEFARDKVP